MGETVKENGCGEDSGYDYYEAEVRQEFEEYAKRKGYNLKRRIDYQFFYFDDKTEDAWRLYHVAHVRGREFKMEKY